MEMLGQLHKDEPIAKVAVLYNVGQVLLGITLRTVVSLMFPVNNINKLEFAFNIVIKLV